MAPTIRAVPTSRWFASFINEWAQLGPDFNWRTWHPFMWEIEDDRMLGAVETSLIIFGLGVRIRYTYTETETMAGIKRSMDEIKENLAVDPDYYASMTPEELIRRVDEIGDGDDCS